jgi:hypothetical protein
MYIESLSTPNAIRYPDQPREPLVEAAGLNEAADYIGRAACSQAATLEVADRIQKHVGRALQYPKSITDYLGDPSATTLESLREYQQTNCIGYTIVGSEAFSQAGINHYIAYANRHFFTVIPTTDEQGEQTGLRSVDMLSPNLNQDLSDVIRYGSPQSIARDLNADPQRHCAVMLDTAALAAKVGKNVETLTAEANSWLSMRSRSFGADPRTDSQASYFSQYSCVMSLYTAETGRDVIEHYVSFQKAVAVGDVAVALSQLSQLRSRYPENDCRAKHSDIRSLIGQLCIEQPQAVEMAVDDYCSSLRTNDPRAIALRADLFRKAAIITRDPRTAAVAAQLYSQAGDQTRSTLPRLKLTYRSKSQKMAALAQEAAQ